MWTKIIFPVVLILALSASVYSQESPTELTLKKSIRMALEHNLDLRIARVQLEETELELDKVEAVFNSQVNLSLSPLQWEGEEMLGEYRPQARLEASLLTPGGTSYNFSLNGQKGENDTMGTSWSASVSQQIIPHPDLDSSSLSLKKSRITLETKRLEFEEEIDDVKQEVMRRFYAILKEEKEWELKQLSLQYAGENLRIANHKLQQGIAGKLDVLDAETELMAAEEALFQAESTLSQDRMDFKDLLGIPWQEDIVVVFQFPGDFQPLGVTLEEAQKKAIENRPQIREQNFQIKLYELDLTQTKSELSPLLNLSFGYTSEQPGLKEAYRTSLTLEVPLMDGGKGEAEVKIAQGKLRKAKLNLEKLKRDIMAEVRGYFLDLKRMEKNVKFLKLSQEKRHQTLEVTKKMFEQGALTEQELQEKEISVKQAEIGLFGTLADYEVARNKLLKSMGRRL